MNLWEILDKGGVVVYLLLGYSVVGVALALYKYLQLLAGGDRPETGLRRELEAASARGVKDLEAAARRATAAELEGLERGLRTLSFLASTAPLLGLLGTVTGMIRAFMVIEENGGKVDAGVLAGGIWEAMITTGVGLTVALALMALLHHLEGLVDRKDQSLFRIASRHMEETVRDDL